MKANIGILAHDLDSLPLDKLTKAISAKGLTSVQLALEKSFGEYFETGTGSLSQGYAHQVYRAFERGDIQIAVFDGISYLSEYTYINR